MPQTLPPSVVIQQSDVQAAANAGLITDSQANALWLRWQDLPSPAAESCYASAAHRHAASASGPQFGMVHVLYYFGGMVAIGAMTLFMTLGFQTMGPTGLLLISAAYFYACLKVADHFLAQSLNVPAGILATLAICLVPLAVWCVQNLLGAWPPAPAGGATDSYTNYHRFVNWRWMTIELATLAAGVVMLWRYRLPFMVMPLAVTVWYMSMDVAHALMQRWGAAGESSWAG